MSYTTDLIRQRKQSQSGGGSQITSGSSYTSRLIEERKKLQQQQQQAQQQAKQPIKTTQTQRDSIMGNLGFKKPTTRSITEQFSDPFKVSVPSKPKINKVVQAGARTLVGAGQQISSTIDFIGDFAAKTIEVTIRGKKDNEKRNALADKWKKNYKEGLGKTLDEDEQFFDDLSELDYLKFRDEWTKAPTEEKFSKELIGETVLNTVPSLISSIGLFAISAPVGFLAAFGSVADDVTEIAIENGVPEENALRLGLVTGLATGWLEKLVPDELFSKAQKRKFTGGLMKRIFDFAVKSGVTGAKEMATEVAQENIQLLAEATVREDLGWDEVKTRNAMAAFGGFLGGTGAQTMVSFMNGVASGELDSTEIKEDITPGTYEAQEILNKVLTTPTQDTKEGREMIKAAVQAKQTGQTVTVKSDTPAKPITAPAKPQTKPVGEVGVKLPQNKQELSDYITKRFINEDIKGTKIQIEAEKVMGDVKSGKISIDEGIKKIDKLQEQLKPSTKPVGGVGDLASEARKYKSAEEFIEAHKKATKGFEFGDVDTPQATATQQFIDIAQKPEFQKIYDQGGNDTDVLRAIFNQSQSGLTPEVKAKKKTDKTFQSRVYDRLKAENPEILTDDMSVEARVLKKESQKAVKLILDDKQKAYRIAMGLENGDILSSSVNIAMAQKALDDGNTKLYNTLVVNRSLAQTRRGQEIVAEKGSVKDNSVSRYVKELISYKMENVGKKYLKGLRKGKSSNITNATEVIDRKTAQLEAKVKKKKINMKEALDLLDSLICV